ncbi:MAG: mannose-1-phosphate guanylyltransferase, partial [Sphingopyxis sp.]|nr:mannose-1-phosphate guanylyltransferase [Sphingopyxis sp.]
MSAMIQPVILSGGAGTRLWPESRGTRAKQFLPLTGGDSLFRQTVARTPAGPHFLPPVILCGDAHVPLVREQIGDREAALVVEPMPRNTAAAIALAVAQADADTLLLVMPSDHVIADVAAFH